MADAAGLEFGAPFPLGNNAGDWGYTDFAIDDAASDKVGMVFQAPDAMTITHIGARVGAYTGSARNYDLRLESVTSTTGDPSGTLATAGSEAAGTSISSSDVDTFKWAALGSSHTCTRGELLAVVVQGASTTSPDGSNNASISYALDNILESPSNRHGFPLSYTDTAGGGWTKNQSQSPLYGIKDGSQAYGYPIESFTLNGIGTNGHRFAGKFTLPSGWFSTFTVRGVHLPGRWTGSTTFRLGLWNAAGTALQQVDFDSDIAASAAQNYQQTTLYFDEATLSELSTGTAYYIGIERVSSSIPLYSVDVNTASPDLTAFAGGDNFNLSYWNTSAWSESGYETSRAMISLLLDDITGGGGTTDGEIKVFG